MSTQGSTTEVAIVSPRGLLYPAVSDCVDGTLLQQRQLRTWSDAEASDGESAQLSGASPRCVSLARCSAVAVSGETDIGLQARQNLLSVSRCNHPRPQNLSPPSFLRSDILTNYSTEICKTSSISYAFLNKLTQKEDWKVL